MIDALKVIGPFKGTSGYDHHTREFVRQFLRLGVRVQLEQHPGWSIELPAEQREPFFDTLDSDVGANTVLHFTMPNRTRVDRKRRNINYTMFEADRIPADWARRAKEHARVVVPTESSFRAWTQSGVPASLLRLCPLGVDGAFFLEPAPALPLETPAGRPIAEVTHRFLNIAELRPRKNHLGLLRTWIRATRPDDDAVLILKLSIFQPDVFQTFQQDLKRMQKDLGRSLAQAAPVCVIARSLSRAELRSLFASATHYISLSKGEGWDLVMMEAAAAGLQLIAPHHSAYLEYLREDDAELIPSTRVPVAFEGKMGREDLAFFRGLSFWQPDEAAAVEVLRGIIGGRRAAKPSPRDRIIAHYSWQSAAQRLLAVLSEPY